VRLVHREKLLEFAAKSKDCEASLSAWAKAIESGTYKHFIALKRTFGSADYVKPYAVFDIAGNKCRLAALINYELGIVSIERVMTHAEYDRGKWRR
jgi:mRNA interferase HigB